MYRRILVPLDGSEAAEKVLPVVIGEARCHQATVVLLRAIAPLRGSLMVTPRFHEQLLQHATDSSETYLQKVSQRLQAEGLSVESVIRSGPPAQIILDYAEESDCDLIVIGSRGETGAARWRFGGIAQKVVKTQTSMPVLVIST